MQTEVFSEVFPLMSTASPQTLEWLLNVAVEHDYPAGRTVLMEDAWGNAVYFNGGNFTGATIDGATFATN